MERLQKVIASSGKASRRKAEELILQGKVKVNGEIVTELGTKVNTTDKIEVANELITKEEKEYYLLNKPRGIITSTNDEKNRKTVIDLIQTTARIYPVGRLDYDTTGLLLLTNDGEFANILMHPKNKILKTYVAKINGILKEEDFAQMRKGILIDNRKLIIDHVKVKKIDKNKNTSLVEVTIHEGRNHIIKKLFASLHYDVLKLTRIKLGNISLGTLQSGEYRPLTKNEINEFLIKK